MTSRAVSNVCVTIHTTVVSDRKYFKQSQRRAVANIKISILNIDEMLLSCVNRFYINSCNSYSLACDNTRDYRLLKLILCNSSCATSRTTLLASVNTALGLRNDMLAVCEMSHCGRPNFWNLVFRPAEGIGKTKIYPRSHRHHKGTQVEGQISVGLQGLHQVEGGMDLNSTIHIMV
ncbi:hypothetical protein J6590_038094 [Homalodisca vitripennis]|nr:hypothetical protein J6590_038094 [Homalodisca vitripennis]